MWTILPDAFYVLCRAVRTKQKKNIVRIEMHNDKNNTNIYRRAT